MRRVAEDVFQIPLSPRDGVNAYLLGDVVVDAGTAGAAKRLVRALQGHAVGVHALTHAHADHAGGSKRLIDAFEVPVWVGERDRVAGGSRRPRAVVITRMLFTPDPARNRDSARRLAALEPELVLFGHGPPLRDPTIFQEFADALPK